MNTPNKRKFGVHTDDFYEEHKKYAKQFECVFCRIVSINNYCLSCLHCICEDCLMMGKDYEKCPEDNTDIIKNINAYNNELIAENQLNNLNIKCIFYKEGCSWCGYFRDFENHLKKHKENLINNNNENRIQFFKENILNFHNNNNYDKENFSIFNKDNLEIIDNNNNNKNNMPNLLNRKRNNENENNNNDNYNNEFNILSNSKKFMDKNDNHTLSFYQNIETFNEEIILPEERDYFDSNSSNSSLSSENYEIMNNNKILIDSSLTLNNFPYNYYFTEPLYYSFTCLIKTKSRNILRDNEAISFGLTNINNNEYIEIISSEKHESLFFKGDLIRISYDNDLFLIYFENDKNNYITVPFKNDEDIRYYPTIVLKDENDILEVSHD